MFHLGGHGDDCYGKYGFPCLPGVGRTCGEGVETEWAAINLVATSVREMTPDARQEILNCHWSFWNWKKITEFGPFFSRKLKEAVYQRNRQRELFEKFTATFSAELVQEWSSAVTAWDAAVLRWQSSLYQREWQPKIKNPYQEPETAVSMLSVRKELLAEEEVERAGGNGLIIHEVTPGMMLLSGLELEEQRRLVLELQSKAEDDTHHLPAAAEAALQQRLITLCRRISVWRDAQILYMPFVTQLLEEGELSTAKEQTNDNCDLPIKDLALFLPSHLGPELLQRCPDRLIKDELRLCMGQTDDALMELRRHLRVRHALLSYKRLHVVGTGQGPNTRAQALVNRYSERIERHFQRYNTAREALTKLDPEGDWRAHYQVLSRSDVVFPSSREDISLNEGEPPSKRVKLSQGRREISWIWLLGVNRSNSGNVEEEINQSMGVEWAKSQARVNRWCEEVLLLAEEMRRVVVWLEWKSQEWEIHSSSRCARSPEIVAGLESYALEQADMYSQMASNYACCWLPILKSNGLAHDWAAKYDKCETPVEIAVDEGIEKGADSDIDYEEIRDAFEDTFEDI